MNNSFQVWSGGSEIWPLEWIAWLNWRGHAIGPVRKASKGKRQIPLGKQEPNSPQLYRKMEFWLSPLPYYIFVFYWARARKRRRVIYWTLPFQIGVIQLLANMGVGRNWFLQLHPLTPSNKQEGWKNKRKALSSHLGFEIFSWPALLSVICDKKITKSIPGCLTERSPNWFPQSLTCILPRRVVVKEVGTAIYNSSQIEGRLPKI